MIRVEGLSKRFGPTEAVSELSFRIEPGEVVGFLGRNGAGKTTTMRVLTGFFPPSAGRVEVAGHDVFEEPLAVKRRIGYLPETPPLYADMVVTAYLRFCARLRGLPGSRAEAAVDEVIERCGLSEVAGRLCGNLSRGYRQRVGIAQALVHGPDVLVLDEPTTALDPGQIREIRQLVSELAGRPRTGAKPAEGGAEPGATGERPRRTVILSTHRLEDVEATCSRVIMIARGRIVFDASLAEASEGPGLEERFLELTRDAESVPDREPGR